MKVRMVALALLLAPTAWTGSADAQAQPLVGQATVVDGDTLELAGQRVRLVAVDAPESDQSCQFVDGQPWPCGRRAAFALADLIGRRHVTCTPTGRDRYRRVLARCRLGSADIGEWLVRHGWAVPYLDCKDDYRPASHLAIRDKNGIWIGAFLPPHEWRKIRRCSSNVPKNGKPC